MPEEFRAAKNNSKGFHIWPRQQSWRKSKEKVNKPEMRKDIVTQAEEIVRRCVAQKESYYFIKRKNHSSGAVIVFILAVGIVITAAALVKLLM